jgi:hypothetical protein
MRKRLCRAALPFPSDEGAKRLSVEVRYLRRVRVLAVSIEQSYGAVVRLSADGRFPARSRTAKRVIPLVASANPR